MMFQLPASSHPEGDINTDFLYFNSYSLSYSYRSCGILNFDVKAKFAKTRRTKNAPFTIERTTLWLKPFSSFGFERVKVMFSGPLAHTKLREQMS